MATKSSSDVYYDEKPKAATQPNGKPKSSKGKKSKLDYTSDGVKDNNIFNLPGSDWQLLAVITVLASVVRLFRIYQPTSVVFDEVHFGGFASKYIKGKFFMDVHPPLAKLLITLAGWLAGFDGNFDFKDIGKDYLEPGVPYVAMRLLPAVCGILSVPTMFLTLKAYGTRTTTAALGALLIVFENGLVTQSRLILLDSPLVIFTAMTALSWVSFQNQHEQGPAKAFTPSWWFWLAATGVTLGATASVKWVGLFTIAWVGSLTILQLWILLADTVNVGARRWFKHFFARVFCLIVIPITFYMAMFAIHFVCLVNPGDGDGFMSSEFQSTLNSKAMHDVMADVAFGSRVSLRHHNTQGGYLHSHNHMYPTGSKQQQITLYPHKDENNVFLLENQTQPIIPGTGVNGTDVNATTIDGPFAWDQAAPQIVQDGSVVRLYHVTTHRRIHSHDVRAPITEADWQNEVSAYGYEGFEGDANDLFRIEIIKSMSDGAEAKERVRTIQTKFKLVHLMTGCVLFSHKVKLPDWGFEQQEVTCARGGTLPNSVWYVEQNEHPKMAPDAEKVNYRNPGFFGKFWELQKVMWRTNAGLVESHAWDSRPPSWPVLKRGINFWGKDHTQIYLIGNPVIWWASTASIALYFVFKGIAVLRWQRSCGDYSNVEFKRFDYEIGVSVLGWAFHYFPFYLMARQLFLHHYFPALYFAILTLCQLYDFSSHRIIPALRSRPYVGQSAAALFLAVSVVAFTIYAPLVYGNKWTQDECKRVKLFDTWDWDCNTFFGTYAEYDSYTPEVAAKAVETGSEAPPGARIGEQGYIEDVKAAVTPKDPGQFVPRADEDGNVIAREEKIEYRDENGNLLNEEQVAELQGKVSFKTRYETRTRVIDADGNEIFEGEVGYDDAVEVEPEDAVDDDGQLENPRGTLAEGVDNPTEGVPEEAANTEPPQVEAIVDGEDKESKSGEAQPASESAPEATRDEL